MHGTVWGNKLGPGPPPRLGRSHVGAPSRLARGHVCPFPGALPSMFPTLGCSFSGPGCGAQADFSASDKDPKESCLWQEWGASSPLPGPEPSPPDIHPAPPSCRRSLFLPQHIHAKEKEGFLERKSIARDRDRGERERTKRSVLSVSRWYKDPVSFFPRTCKHLRVGTLPVLSLMNLQCLRGERKNSTYQHAHGEGFLGDGSYYSLFVSFLQRTYIKYIKRINNRCICLI